MKTIDLNSDQVSPPTSTLGWCIQPADPGGFTHAQGNCDHCWALHRTHLAGISAARNWMARKPVSIEIVEEPDGGRSILRTFADGYEEREPIDLTKKPTRRPRMPRQRIKSERMDKTRREADLSRRRDKQLAPRDLAAEIIRRANGGAGPTSICNPA